MGLYLSYNLFYDVTPNDVYDALNRFYGDRNVRLTTVRRDTYATYELHELNGSWAVLDWSMGSDSRLHREAQLFVSKDLGCPEFFIIVDDGDYWGYEFIDKGIVLDYFVNEPGIPQRFPGKPATGNAQIVASHLGWLSPDDIAPYLVQSTHEDGEDGVLTGCRGKLDVPPRPGDEYTRFAELAVLNFLRLLGINIGMEDRLVTLQTPVWKSFWIE